MPYDLKTIVSHAGGTVRVARACGVSPGAVSHWQKAGALPISEITGRTRYSEVIAEMLKEESLSADEIKKIGLKL